MDPDSPSLSFAVKKHGFLLSGYDNSVEVQNLYSLIMSGFKDKSLVLGCPKTFLASPDIMSSLLTAVHRTVD